MTLEEKIYNGVNLTEDEIKDAICYLDEYDCIDYQYDEKYRWVQSIIKIKDKLFAIDWKKGLTNCTKDMYFIQPYEVVRNTKLVEEVSYEPAK